MQLFSVALCYGINFYMFLIKGTATVVFILPLNKYICRSLILEILRDKTQIFSRRIINDGVIKNRLVNSKKNVLYCWVGYQYIFT